MSNVYEKYLKFAYENGKLLIPNPDSDHGPHKEKTLGPLDYQAIREAQIFIIDESLWYTGRPINNEEREKEDEELGELFLPFKNCFFCVSGNVPFYTDAAPEGVRFLNVGIHIVETGFRKYDIRLFAVVNFKFINKVSYMLHQPFIADKKSISLVLEKILMFVNRFPVATVESDKIKYKVKGQGIRFFKPNSTIYISTKAKRDSKYQYEGKKTTWYRRFAKRGHWRRFFIEDTDEIDYSKTGKDREGNYVVKGMTWVVDHIIGPDDAPLIRQTRVIKNPVFLDDINDDMFTDQ